MRPHFAAFRDWTAAKIGANRKTLLAFSIPAAILLLAYLTRGIYPIGDRSVLTIDLYHQYAPFLADLRRKLLGAESLLFSWSGGLGTNFWALYAYYLASPLNIFILLFPQAHLTEAILFLIVLKTGLSGACFFLYLRGVWHKENHLMVALAGLYALSAYALSYSWNIMWLDSLYLLPLLMLGLNDLIRRRRCLLYIISLALIIMVNYYIAFFIVLFTLLYFPVCLFTQLRPLPAKRWLKAVLRFTLSSLLAAGLSGILLLPTYASLQLTSAADDAFPQTATHYFDFFDYIGQHFILSEPTIRSGMPNLYSGVIVLLLVPLFFLSRSFSLRSKFLHFFLILALILSFNLNVLNFIWHGMHFPNQLPYRNSFVYVFLMLSLCYPGFLALKEYSGKAIGTLAGLLILIVLLAQKVFTETPSELSLLLTIVFIAIHAGVLCQKRLRQIHFADWSLIVLFVMVAELLINTLISVHTIDQNEHYSSRDGYLAGVEAAQMREEIRDLERQHDTNDFYRMEVFPPKTTNDPFLYGYRGLSIFSSTMPTRPVQTFQNLGYHSNGINSYKYEGSTIVLDSLFSLRYTLFREPLRIEDDLRPLWLSTQQVDLYKNPYALPLGFMGTADLEHWSSRAPDPFIAQNRLISALTGDDRDVFVPVTIVDGDQDNITISRSGQTIVQFNRSNEALDSMVRLQVQPQVKERVYLYLDVTPNQPDHGFVMLGEERINFNARRSTLVDIGHVTPQTPIEFHLAFSDSAPASGNFEFHAYALDTEVFIAAMEQLADQALTLDRFSARRLSGTVEASEEGILFLSMPYDSGWKFTVNEKTVDPIRIDEGLIGLPLAAGTHEIKMQYRTPWVLPGALLSLISLLILGGYIVFFRQRQHGKKARPAPRIDLGRLAVDNAAAPKQPQD